MPDADLNLITRQYDRIITEVGILRDELRVNTAMATRLEESAQASRPHQNLVPKSATSDGDKAKVPAVPVAVFGAIPLQ